MANELENVVLGSGDLYVTDWTAASEIPTDETIEVDSNLIGRIQGGASLEYKPTSYVVEDDSGAVCRRFVTAEEAKFKTGVLTWCIPTLGKLVAAGTVITKDNRRRLTIGGCKGREISKHLLRFVHTYSSGLKLRVTMVGTSDSGFAVDFAPDKETVIDAEWAAVSHNSSGHLLIIDEELPSQAGTSQADNSQAGAGSGS